MTIRSIATGVVAGALFLPLLASALAVKPPKGINKNIGSVPDVVLPVPNIGGQFWFVLGGICVALPDNSLLQPLRPGFCPDVSPPPPPPPAPTGDPVISEIMYSPLGDDTGHEWIEVRNDSSDPVDLSTWMFSESSGDKSLTIMLGEAVVPPGGFAVIASNSTLFLEDWPGFTGVLFDSESFSLSNDGETVALKSMGGDTVDSVTYTPAQGANGDGNSLHKVGDLWEAAPPTPGAPAALP